MAIQDLEQRFPITDENGQATDYFMRLLQERGVNAENIEELVIELEEEVQILASQLADKADKTIQLTAGLGLSGGGDLSADRTFDLASYIFGAFFTTTPTDSETLMIHVAAAAFTVPADFIGGLRSNIGTNPAVSFVLDVTNNGATIGTITVSTGGVVTATTVGNTSKPIAVGDVFRVIGPATADTTIADAAFTFIGVR